jgi:hypothetical protein
MRLAFALVLIAATAAADTTPPKRWVGRWARCAAALEAARDRLGERYSIVRDAEVVSREGGLALSFEDGWCMHHTSGEISILPQPRHRAFRRRRNQPYGYTVTRGAPGLLATITYYDKNESESGNVDGLDVALLEELEPAIDRCLSD